MAKSKIIKQLVNNEITTKQALERMLILAKDIKDKNLEKWIKSEIQGYGKNEVIPKYRKIPICYVGTYRTQSVMGLSIVGGVHKNAMLPTLFLDNKSQKEKDEFFNKFIDISIEMLEQIIKDKEEVAEVLNPKLFQIFQYKTNIEVLSAKKVFDRIYLSKIVEKVRVKILDILVELEKEFGCLDDLDIDIENKGKKEKQEIYNIIKVIIQDNHIENNIEIGDNNEILDSTITNKNC
ncbi:AbiTii domain-containing protein [Helicobacter sp. T3_23-1056]